MFSLILVTILIAITAMSVLVTINYLPTWAEPSQMAQDFATEGVLRLERAYDAATAANNDNPPVPTATSDGGLSVLIGPHVGFMPKAPVKMAWSYGLQGQPGSFQNLNYFCLSGNAVNKGEYLGVAQAAASLGSYQATLGSSCGATAAAGIPSQYPVAIALTYYVQHVPGVQ